MSLRRLKVLKGLDKPKV